MSAAQENPGLQEPWHPRHNPWLIAISVMLATFMEVLDTSVANVSLPHIAGNLSATTDESTWVLTSYLVSNAIILPASGWLSNYFGRKRLLIACIAIFTAASALAGVAPTLGWLIVARALQGAGGGALQPLSQAILLESFAPAERGVAMAAFGMGIVVAPTIGPTLGGWLTDSYSWRWIFYINLPIGLLAILMVQTFVHDPQYIKSARERVRANIDYIGFGLMAVWLATLQVILDKGQEDDWFSAEWIRWAAAVSVLCMIGFIIRELRTGHPIVDLRILKNRNFAVGIALMAIIGGILYSTIAQLPLFLQTLMGYSALLAGYALSPRGLGSICAMIVIGRITKLVDNRALMAGGFLLLAYSSFQFGNINLSIGMSSVIWPNVLNGIAVSFIFVPLTTVTMGTLRNEEMGNASGIFNLMRNLGGSIGISAVTTLIARGAQVHQAMMVGHLTPYRPVFQLELGQLHQALAPQVGSHLATHQAQALLYNTLVQQANVWAFVDNFRWIALISLLCVPAVFLFRKVAPPVNAAAAH
jgi:DHA2 family multidrug resistance protein